MKSESLKTATLEQVPESGKSMLTNLMQLYLHDFSEFGLIGTDHGEVLPDGRFPYAWLDHYWREEGRFPLSLHADGRLAGFALVNRWSALDRPIDHSVAEFFVLRKYCRAGVGTRAAKQIFYRFTGRWEVPVAWYNQPALDFWRAVTRRVADSPVEECPGDGLRWRGIVLTFTIPG